MIVDRQLKWDKRYMEMAKLVASWSKDPSTQTGAVIVKNNQVIAVGYNGFPKGVEDTPERLNNRELKYKMIIHCEINAMIGVPKHDLEGATLYTWPFASCSRCAVQVIQAGIKRCVAPPIPEELKERWAEELQLTENMFKEAGIEITYLEE